MRKLRKWMFALGVMATAPAVGLAGPFSLPSNPFKAEKVTNQEVAEKVASALRTARLQGENVAIDFDNGVATLSGTVTDAAEKDKATKVVEQIAGVKKVDNQLAVKTPIRQASPSLKQASPGLKQASFFQGAGESRFGGIRRVSEEQAATPAPGPSNQETAERIAAAMSAAGLNGYDIQIGFQSGTAQLSGQVASNSQRALAESVASKVPGVQSVANRLTVPGANRRGPAMPAQRGPGMPPQTNSRQLAAQQQQMYAQMAYQAQIAQAQAQAQGQGYGMPNAAGTQIAHNSPNLPAHAFPSYAAYPNYAAVSYPKQYSASAWPYIGPFYPYPQVPMGWRQATLEWDDGAWNLKFDTKTDKWWWFVHPKNW